MFKSIVAVGSLIAGAATAATVVYMQTNPLAFTSARNEDGTSFAVTRRDAPPTVYWDEVAEDEEAVPAEPMVAPKPKAKLVRKPPAAAPKRGEPASTPCNTEWRDIGVKAIAGPGGSEARRVRQLCP